MKIIRNNLLPVGRQYAAINLFGMLLIKHGVRVTPELINHERIHSAQMRELLYLPFYIAYLAEWKFRNRIRLEQLHHQRTKQCR